MAEPLPDAARGTADRAGAGTSTDPGGAAHEHVAIRPPQRDATGEAALMTLRRAVAVATDCLLGLTVVVVAVLYRLPPIPSDPINYLVAARNFPHHPVGAIEHQYLRIGLVLPLRLTYDLFGYSQVAYLVVPILAALLLVMSVHALGSLLFNRYVGVAAALLTLTNSVVFPDLTQPGPDVPAAALLVTAFVLALALRQRRPWPCATPRREVGVLLAIGGLLGWSYLCREYVVFCWPAVPLLLLHRLPWRRLLWIVVPLAVVAIGEAILGWLTFHDPLARLHASSSHGSGPPIATDYLDQARSWYLLRFPEILRSSPEGWWLRMTAVAAIAGTVFSRRLRFLGAWAALFFLPLVILGGWANPHAPMLRLYLPRYWVPLVPTLALACAGVTYLLLRYATHLLVRYVTATNPRGKWIARVAGMLTLLAVVVPVGVSQQARATNMSVPLNRAYAANGGTHFEQLRTWLAGHRSEVRTIWGEHRTLRIMGFFANSPAGTPVWKGHLRTWSKAGAKPASGDHVLLYSAYSDACQPCRLNVEHTLGIHPVRPPTSWHLVFTTGDRVVQLYRVG
ncbi:glycosyltransferase family 39 protein [Actinopolymorpha sp. NPDC004070]|uniref:ArnT family glycosyltransferase n=1 Tax=Actinopolymorpha sp. NPDC004070 TaxID=3154548 RepID=UPI0033BE59E9